MLRKLCLVAFVTILIAACSTQTFNMGRPSTLHPKLSDNQTFFVGGIAQDKTINAAEVCGGASRVGTVEVQQSFLNVFLSIVTFGIYTPREARVYCTR